MNRSLEPLTSNISVRECRLSSSLRVPYVIPRLSVSDRLVGLLPLKREHTPGSTTETQSKIFWVDILRSILIVERILSRISRKVMFVLVHSIVYKRRL